MKSALNIAIATLVLGAGCSEDAARHYVPTDSGHLPDGGVAFDLSQAPPPDGEIIIPDDGSVVSADPQTCADAATLKSYVGCDYWPTVTANSVSSDFDFAVVVANTSMNVANVTVTGPNNFNQTATVQPSALTKIFLPWVQATKLAEVMCVLTLQGPTLGAPPLTQSVLARKSAYHLVSSVPVTVYQFNPLEYQGVGGPPGKDWSNCANQMCVGQCYSFTNDASLLLPSTAMTGNYRVTAQHSLSGEGATITVTATQDATTVTVKLSPTGQTLAGAGGTPAAIAAGGKATFTLDSGDVLELAAHRTSGGLFPMPVDVDLGGSLVQADKPVQVIAGDACLASPTNACDHIEESVFPVETLGKHYIVATPTGPNGDAPGDTVRIYGNVDGTHLTFNPPLSGVPTTINAGQVIDLGNCPQGTAFTTNFEVTGDHEFAVAMTMLSASVVDPATTPSRGDPSLSLATAVEQYRTKYVFLAPEDYSVNYVDVIAPMGTNIMLDGAAVSATATPIASGYGISRVKLSAGAQQGAHVITADQPIGIQVMGYGDYTSYQYPGGLDLKMIAPPPPPIT
jgi:hypothetical protein